MQGLDADELFDATPVVDEAAGHFYGNPDYANLPRKHKYTISACPDRCNAPEINCIALIGASQDGREGFAVRVGGGLSSVPRIAQRPGRLRPDGGGDRGAARDHGRLVGRTCATASRASRRGSSSWSTTSAPRGCASASRRGSAARSRTTTCRRSPPQPRDHLGVHAQKQDGLVYVGVPVTLGLISGDQMIALADLAEPLGGDVRDHPAAELHRSRRPRRERLDEVVARARARSASRSTSTRCAADSIACTGEPHCNFSVTETKTRLGRLLDALEERFGDDVAGLRLHLDGCPHACAQHWVGDLGFQGTTARDDEGEQRQAYDIFVRGGARPGRRDRPPALPPRADGGARRRGGRPVRGWLDDARRRALPGVLRSRKSDDELGRARRARAGARPRARRLAA